MEFALQQQQQQQQQQHHHVEFVFFDYDGTLTTPVFVERVQKWAISDKPAVCALLTPAELERQFGGQQRLAILRLLFTRLRELGISLHIVSHGRLAAIERQLAAVGLLQEGHFSRIVASDSRPLQAVDNDKGAYIAAVLSAAGVAARVHCIATVGYPSLGRDNIELPHLES